jgi:hypothetical protein
VLVKINIHNKPISLSIIRQTITMSTSTGTPHDADMSDSNHPSQSEEMMNSPQETLELPENTQHERGMKAQTQLNLDATSKPSHNKQDSRMPRTSLESSNSDSISSSHAFSTAVGAGVGEDDLRDLQHAYADIYNTKKKECEEETPMEKETPKNGYRGRVAVFWEQEFRRRSLMERDEAEGKAKELDDDDSKQPTTVRLSHMSSHLLTTPKKEIPTSPHSKLHSLSLESVSDEAVESEQATDHQDTHKKKGCGDEVNAYWETEFRRQILAQMQATDVEP